MSGHDEGAFIPPEGECICDKCKYFDGNGCQLGMNEEECARLHNEDGLWLKRHLATINEEE